MKSLFLFLFVGWTLMAQTNLCESGQVRLVINPHQDEECYKKLSIKDSYKYRFCDSGLGFLYNDNQYAHQLHFRDSQWVWRVDILDYSNDRSKMTKLLIDKDLKHFQYTVEEKNFKGQELRQLSCEGRFLKH